MFCFRCVSTDAEEDERSGHSSQHCPVVEGEADVGAVSIPHPQRGREDSGLWVRDLKYPEPTFVSGLRQKAKSSGRKNEDGLIWNIQFSKCLSFYC